MEHRFHHLLQPGSDHRLGDPVGDRWHPKHPHTTTLFRIDTARTGGGKYDPDDIRFQIRYRLFFRSFSKSSRVTPSTPGAPLFARTRWYASQTSHFEISNDFPCDTDVSTRFLPGTLVDRLNKS